MTNRKFRRVIGDDPKVLYLMRQLGFKLGFGDLSLDEVCIASGINPELFSILCDIYTTDNPQIDLDSLSSADIPVLLRFLRVTHKHYLEVSSVALHENVHKMTEFCTPENSDIVGRFFDGFDAEMKRHIDFEEDVVFSYIEGLLRGERNSLLSVGMIAEMHSNVEEKLEDFKNIVMNYLPGSSTSDVRYDVLIQILKSEDILRRHTAVEDRVLLPLAEMLEQDEEENAGSDAAEPASTAKASLV